MPHLFSVKEGEETLTQLIARHYKKDNPINCQQQPPLVETTSYTPVDLLEQLLLLFT